MFRHGRLSSGTQRIALALVCLAWVGGVALAQVALPLGVQRMHPYPASRVPSPKQSQAQAPVDQGPVLYYGGPVLANVQVVAVFWTSAVDPGTQSNAQPFYSAVTNSPFMDLLAQYSTFYNGRDGHPGSNQQIGYGSFAGAYTIIPSAGASGKLVTDAQVQAELAKQVQAGKLPGFNANTVYIIYFPLGYTITLAPGVASCQQFCAYHNTALTSNKAAIPYAVIPDQTNASPCYGGCGLALNYISDLDVVCSHELAEAITDPQVGLVTSKLPRRPAAWVEPDPTTGGQEIGDKCAFDHERTVNGVEVQAVWSNRDQNCGAWPQATQFGMLGPAEVQAGTLFNIRAKAEDVDGHVDPYYAITSFSPVFFSSSDPNATLPQNDGFSVGDGGLRLFSNFVLTTAGNQVLSIARQWRRGRRQHLHS